MKYQNIISANFINRPNRFIANVKIGENIEKAHVKNTGRLGELLKEGASVFLEDHYGRMGSRKLRYSLIGVTKENDSTGEIYVNIDSQAPNKVVRESLESGLLKPWGMENISLIRSECKYGDSRIDFYVEDSSGKGGFIEVKGVTLEENGMAAFPDAPTERGIKHIEELIGAVADGYRGCIVFVIQMKGISCFIPNRKTHPEFGEALVKAADAGVEVLAFDCVVTEDGLNLDKAVPVLL